MAENYVSNYYELRDRIKEYLDGEDFVIKENSLNLTDEILKNIKKFFDVKDNQELKLKEVLTKFFDTESGAAKNHSLFVSNAIIDCLRSVVPPSQIREADRLDENIFQNLITIGYSGSNKITVKQAAEWMEQQFPKSILREGYYLWRKDLLEQALKKYPSKEQYYQRRNYIVELAINEIWQLMKDSTKIFDGNKLN